MKKKCCICRWYHLNEIKGHLNVLKESALLWSCFLTHITQLWNKLFPISSERICEKLCIINVDTILNCDNTGYLQWQTVNAQIFSALLHMFPGFPGHLWTVLSFSYMDYWFSDRFEWFEAPEAIGQLMRDTNTWMFFLAWSGGTPPT